MSDKTPCYLCGYVALTNEPHVCASASIRARIANLEAARAETFGQFQHMAKVALEQQRRAEKAEADLARLKSSLLRNGHPSGRPEMGTK